MLTCLSPCPFICGISAFMAGPLGFKTKTVEVWESHAKKRPDFPTLPQSLLLDNQFYEENETGHFTC